jgi:hypothetical protein
MKQRRSSFVCPNCGADVVGGARACRECGSDARTGWQSGEEIDYQGVDIPDGYGGERDETPRAAARVRRYGATVVIVLLVLALAVGSVLRWS